MLPVTLPEASTDAFVFEEDHAPPSVASVRTVIPPNEHTEGTVVVPVIDATAGNELTVTISVTTVLQPKPLLTEYWIVEVPAELPVILPDASTEALRFSEVQSPPGVTSLRVVEPPAAHTEASPVIGETVGTGFTVTVVVAVLEQLLASVPVTVYESEPVAGVNDAPSVTPPVQL